MISQIEISNFKCLVSKKIEFAPLTVLVGANGSGKSTVVQSLLLSKELLERAPNVGDSCDISINGPYMMQIGQASAVFSNQEKPTMTFDIRGTEGEKAVLTYTYDGKDDSHLLLGTVEECTQTIRPLNGAFQYLHAERLGPRKSLDMSKTYSLDVGCQGEFVYHALHTADWRMKRSVHESLVLSGSTESKFSHHVENWMQFLFPHLRFDYDTINPLNKLTMKFSNAISASRFCSPPNTGFGISYTLPIVVSGLLLSKERHSVLVVENPEAHLHPLGQSHMGRFLAVLAQSGVQVIVETHSEHVINGMRIFMARKNLASDLSIQYFSQKEEGIQVEKLELKENGELSHWPAGFFDQEQIDLHELMKIKRGKG